MAFRMMREFIKYESSGGVVLFAAAVLALIVDNSPLHHFYVTLLHLPLVIGYGQVKLVKPLLLWINEGLMTIFFFLVGLEIKREMLEGEINSLRKVVLPGVAAVGGMLVPALFYLYFNWGDSTALRGWAIPTATDIAFSLGILSLLGSRIPPSLKIFLTALAIFDDIGAIVVIAVFYSAQISLLLLFVALGLILVLILLNRLRVSQITPYILVGAILWVCVLKSGVHATLTGVVLAFCIPMRDRRNPAMSPVRQLEHDLHPWVAFGVLPLFAFANAGVSFAGLRLHQLLSPITIGIAAGLFLGKQLGIWGFSWLAIKLKLARMPHGASWMGLYGISLVAGVGFTMSLFIGGLAFSGLAESYGALVRLGVLAGSFASGLLGYLLLRVSCARGQKETLG